MKNIKYYFFSLLFLTACGGSGETSPESVTTITPVASAPTPQITAELKTSYSFDFMSNYNLVLQINNLPDSTDRFYINVCSDYKEIEGRYEINYDSCVLRIGLNNPHREFQLVLSDNEQQLIAQIWPIENAAEPVNKFWNKTQEDEIWVISLQ
jgi:hypothetical protein